MSISHRQYCLIRLQIVFGDIFRVHFLARQQFPQTLPALKHSVLNRDNTFGIDQYRGIAYQKHITLFTDAIMSVERTSLVHVGHQVGTGYRTDILPTILKGLILYEIIIILFLILFRRFIF